MLYNCHKNETMHQVVINVKQFYSPTCHIVKVQYVSVVSQFLITVNYICYYYLYKFFKIRYTSFIFAILFLESSSAIANRNTKTSLGIWRQMYLMLMGTDLKKKGQALILGSLGLIWDKQIGSTEAEYLEVIDWFLKHTSQCQVCITVTNCF